MTLLAAAVEQPSCYSRTVNDWWCGAYLRDYRTELVDATVQHLLITVSAIGLGLALAFPLALMARRRPRLETGIVGFSTGLYTVPSLALFPLLVPFTGISATTVVIGLALYALTILVRSILDGLRSVPEEVRESARGLGYSRSSQLLRIELPLALPVFMAGLRVATVSTVALTTVGALVANGGLGNLIAEGVLTNFKAELLAACVLCVLIALLLDVLLVAAQRLVTPWTRTQVSR
ncbi:MAG: ABC transporter, permease protein (cluster 13, osmolytes) [uncultured Nocardioides sp.]|uniref:ABC transporter, permease protein (Cluster 13, osmolytes) n=1 Tax=uncultured Nocardioides sp. TaxID=198441 RepID=A0A6J4NNT1_9ACTN|nr:MAG: ABC transporter, permease protein (cluster 13, osmolytes) [uncultured Nocardioides sp.]